MARRKLTSSLATLALIGAGIGAVSTSQANAESAAKPTTTTLASDLLSPLSLAVAKDGTTYFSQNFAGLLMKLKPGQKKPKVIYGNTDGFEVGAVSERDGRVLFALSKFNRRGVIMAVGRQREALPDRQHRRATRRRTTRTPRTPTASATSPPSALRRCPQEFGPPTYKGIVETHPFATTQAGGRRTSRTRRRMPSSRSRARARSRPSPCCRRLPVKITAAAAETFGMPACVAGKRYAFEGVPTDVEMGPDG